MKRAKTGLVEMELSRVAPSAESVYYVLASIAVHNRLSRAAVVRRYQITWPGGRFEAQPRQLTVPPQSTRPWRARIDPSCGDLRALLDRPSGARIEALEVDSP